MSQRGPAMSSIVNQRSPLLVSLFPSPHLFLGSRARRQSPLQAEHGDTKALREQLNQQLASVSFVILGKSLKEFGDSILKPHGEPRASRDGSNGKDHPAGRALLYVTQTRLHHIQATTEQLTSDTE